MQKKEVLLIYDLFKSKVYAAQHPPGKPKITYKKLAEMTGLSEATIKAFMCGSRESDTTAKAIGKALGIEV